MEKINDKATVRLWELIANLSQRENKPTHLLDLGSTVHLTNYTRSLEVATQVVFSVASRRWAPLVVRCLQLGMPRTISTTFRDRSEMPVEFEGWKRLNPE
ncbi:MAG: hypothetical protein M1838_003750 [Thelocarpon superellum]|nr:MAG: hypothetical protein M1838_003750 [Thelocarpon superellum]